MIQIINQTGLGVVVVVFWGGFVVVVFEKERERRCKGGKH